MANNKGFDEVLGVSKKRIRPTSIHNQVHQSKEAKEQLSSTIEKMKEKSEELSSRGLETSTQCKVSSRPSPSVDASEMSSTFIDESFLESPVKNPRMTKSPAEVASEPPVDLVEDGQVDQERQEVHDTCEKNTSGMGVDHDAIHDGQASGGEDERSEFVDHLYEEIRFLKKQLEVKDHQLDKKDELILNFQVLLKSEQDKVLRLESSLGDDVSKKDENVSEQANNWLVRLFGKKTR